MDSPLISNVSVYKAIAVEAYLKMNELIDAHRRPKPDGSKGWIITFDPDQKCFKQAMIAIVFTGMWLEALLHLIIVRDHGEDKFREYDFNPYEEKLQLLGCNDRKILDMAKRFRKCRKELVHEKAYFDKGEIKKSQDEAENAYGLLTAVSHQFKAKNG